MATAVTGQLSEFNPQTDSLTAYVERVKLFMQANSIEDARKVPVFLSVLGGKTYDLLRNLLSSGVSRGGAQGARAPPKPISTKMPCLYH